MIGGGTQGPGRWWHTDRMSGIARPGSGGVSPTARAVETVLSGLFDGSPRVTAATDLDRLHGRGKSGISARQLNRSGAAVVGLLGLPVRRALTPDPSYLGDIRLELSDGTIAYVEVKAQTTGRFDGLSSADWAREETDFLRYLYHSDRRFSRRLPAWMARRLTVPNPRSYFTGWGAGDLWLADIAGLPDADRRSVAGVANSTQLYDFMSCKYFVHVTAGGTQACRLTDLPEVDRLHKGGTFNYALFSPPKSSVGVYVGEDPTRGGFDFAYYVAYRTTYKGKHVVGRHKLTSRALPKSPTMHQAKH